MAQELLTDERLNNILMEHRSCNLLQLKNKKWNKQIQKKIEFNEESMLYEKILQNRQTAHSSLLIKARLLYKLKEKSK